METAYPFTLSWNDDTNNIVEYVEYQKDKNKKKYHFWELLK